MMLSDTGPLVALLNRKDPNHAACAEATKHLPPCPLVTTWPCFTEAMYLLHRAGGYPGQQALWQFVEAGRLVLHEPNAREVQRTAEFMAKYKDLPMDFADASIMAAAERLGTQRVFTLDRDFYIYRFADGTAVEVVR